MSPGAATTVPANNNVKNPRKSAVRAGTLPFISHSVSEEGLLPSEMLRPAGRDAGHRYCHQSMIF